MLSLTRLVLTSTKASLMNLIKNAEKINGRWAMLGLVAGVTSYICTGNFFFFGLAGF
ncbi:MAG: hypothetical protein CM15mV2_1600 [uncultured marine virus]|nr:MAG: hypothetical protein CM15mV2_1600 [uncultured marine virus]